MANYADDSPLSISLAPNLGSVELTDREDGQTITLPIIGYSVVVRFSYLNNRSDCAAVCADETSISPVVIDQSGQPVGRSQLGARPGGRIRGRGRPGSRAVLSWVSECRRWSAGRSAWRGACL